MTLSLVVKAVADDILLAINDVNTRVRQTKGRSDREFTEKRMQVMTAELRIAENTLRYFLENNLSVYFSPNTHLIPRSRKNMGPTAVILMVSLQTPRASRSLQSYKKGVHGSTLPSLPCRSEAIL